MPDRPVLCLQADGSAMYTLQSLWTQAREGLDVTTVLYDNRSYAILNIELGRVGAGAGGPRAQSLLDLSNPALDWVALAQGMGVDAARPDNAEEFTDALEGVATRARPARDRGDDLGARRVRRACMRGTSPPSAVIVR